MGIALARAEPLQRLVDQLGGVLRGAPPEQAISRLSGAQDATLADELALLTQPRYLPYGNATAAVVLATPELGKGLNRAWLHPHPAWVIAQLLSRLAPLEDMVSAGAGASGAHVHPSAVVHPSVSLDPSVVVEANAVVFPRVSVGRRVVIGAGSVVGRPGFGWAQGPHGSVVRIPQLAGVTLEDDVELGALCTVDAGCLRPTWLGAGTKLDAQVHVGHNVRLGAGCLVAAQSGFAGSCELGSGVRVGGQSGVADHVRVGDGAQIAAKTGVIRDVPAGEVVAGFPAVARARWLRGVASVFGRRSPTAARDDRRLDGSDD